MDGKDFTGQVKGRYVGLEGEVDEYLRDKTALLMKFDSRYYLAQFDDTCLERHFYGGHVVKYAYCWHLFLKECFVLLND